MEPTLIFTLIVSIVLVLVLVPGAVRSIACTWRKAFARLGRRATRLLALSLAALAGFSALRLPAAATTPPPSVRLVGPVTTAIAAADAQATTYEVQPGDCLWRIARALLVERGERATGTDIERSWRAIYDANRMLIGSNPDLIHPGQQLAIPVEF